MKTSTIALSLLLTVVSARSLGAQTQRRAIHRAFGKREVPQEHSHEKFLTAVGTSLNLNNPDKIADPVFGLLGAAAAIKGAGDITDADCLQQATADQAFTNAKAVNDVTGMTAALVYRTLERNTGSVGLKSVPCTSIKAVNPEIAALSQHQDPASDGAAAENKAIVLELAVQIQSIGGDPTVALQSGTFAPGKIGDPTAKGNTCDDQNDPEGCIYTQNLLVEDASAAEIAAAVKGVAAGTGAAATTTAADAAATTAAAVDTAASTTVAAVDTAASTTAAAADTAAASTTVAADASSTTAAADASTTAAADASTTAAADASSTATDAAATTTAAADASTTAAAATSVAAGADAEETLPAVPINDSTSIRIIIITKGGTNAAVDVPKKKGKKHN